MAAFVLLAAAVTVAGRVLYPAWWYLGPAPLAFGVSVAVVVACLRGRSRPAGRIAATVVCAACCVLTALATADTVDEAGNAMQPLLTAFVGLNGFLDRPGVAIPMGAGLVGTHMGAVAATRPLDAADVVVLSVIHLAILAAAVAGGRLARRAAADQDEANARLSGGLIADRAAAASRADRREQERELHDTVLSTLTALARASLPGSARVRARCAADARYLRALGARDDGDPAPPDLLADLRSMVDTAVESCRLRLHVDAAETVLALPDRVVLALVRAAREAVTNAERHSGSDVVDVRLRWSADQVAVEVVDGGRAPARPAAGDRLGVRRSIVERMADVGGRGATVQAAGSGTRVVLTWPG